MIVSPLQLSDHPDPVSKVKFKVSPFHMFDQERSIKFLYRVVLPNLSTFHVYLFSNNTAQGIYLRQVS